MAMQYGKKKRTCGAQKSGARKYSGGPAGTSTNQGFRLGHVSTNQGLLKLPDTSSVWSKGGPTEARQKVYRKFERCCQCTRHSACNWSCTCRDREVVCKKYYCLNHFHNPVVEQKSTVTVGLRSIPRCFFPYSI